MLSGTITKLESQEGILEVTLILYQPVPTYLTPLEDGYDEAVQSYQLRLAEYDLLHLGGCQLQQAKRG